MASFLQRQITNVLQKHQLTLRYQFMLQWQSLTAGAALCECLLVSIRWNTKVWWCAVHGCASLCSHAGFYSAMILTCCCLRHPRMLESFCEMPVDKMPTTKFGVHGQCIWQSVLHPTMLLVAIPSMVDATQSLQVLALTGDREFMEQWPPSPCMV